MEKYGVITVSNACAYADMLIGSGGDALVADVKIGMCLIEVLHLFMERVIETVDNDVADSQGQQA